MSESNHTLKVTPASQHPELYRLHESVETEAESNAEHVLSSRPGADLLTPVSVTTSVEDGMTASDVDEQTVVEEIASLWVQQKRVQAELRIPRAAAAENRLALQEALFSFKQRLCRTGRSGEWAAFTRSIRMPLSTADRYVIAWSKRVEGSAVEQIAAGDVTDQDLAKLTKKMVRSVTQVITSPEAMARFLRLFDPALQAACPWISSR